MRGTKPRQWHGRRRRRGAAVPERRYVTVRRVDRPYVGLQPVEEDRRGTLPGRFLAGDAVTLPLAGADDRVLAARIEAATGLGVRFVGAARDDAGGLLGAPDGLSPSGGIWSGPLDRLLDAWTEEAGHEWRYDAEAARIEIVRRRAAVFRVNALAGAERHGASSSTRDRAGDEGSGSLRRPVHRERDRLRPLARDRSAACGTRR